MLSGICRENQGDGMPPSVMDNPTGRFWNEKKSCQDIKHSPLWAGDAEGTGQRASATCGRKDKRQSGTRLESSAPLAWCWPHCSPSRVLTPALELSTTCGLDITLGRHSVHKTKKAE